MLRLWLVPLLFAGCVGPAADGGASAGGDEGPASATRGVPVLLVDGTHSFEAPEAIECDLTWHVDLFARTIKSSPATGDLSAALVTRIVSVDQNDGCYPGHRLVFSDDHILATMVGQELLAFQFQLVDGIVHVNGTGLPPSGALLAPGASVALGEGDWRLRYLGHFAKDATKDPTGWPFGVTGHWYPETMPDRTYAMLHVTSDIKEEGPDYVLDSACGQSLPVAEVQAALQSVWIDGRHVALDPWHDQAILVGPPRVQYMHDSGCGLGTRLYGGGHAFSLVDRIVQWNITRCPGLVVDGHPMAPGDDVTRHISASQVYAAGPRQGQYWYNGTVTLTYLGDWSWQDVHPVGSYRDFPSGRA